MQDDYVRYEMRDGRSVWATNVIIHSLIYFCFQIKDSSTSREDEPKEMLKFFLVTQNLSTLISTIKTFF